ncbi:hypothetical protein DW886_02200 [Enterocloster aldenensis]|uniref:hypothetical protein n=1 Tax=Enterocloster aldenensis TaxID=358742 RepID=UPI000E520B3E|nr:hypothetical protein DW886_02200 [Enterocloster aldenensis]
MKKDDNKYFWEYFSNANIEQEKLEEIIRAYSHFLSISNSDFKYNETYLPSFCYEFLNFKEKGTLKYNFLIECIKEISNEFILMLDNKRKISLEIDNYWYMQLGENLDTIYSDPAKIAENVIYVDASDNGYFTVYITDNHKMFGLGRVLNCFPSASARIRILKPSSEYHCKAGEANGQCLIHLGR